MIQSIGTGHFSPVLQTGLAARRREPEAGEASVSLAAASATRDVDASLSITTKEGDTVSISASYDATATYAGVRGRDGRASAWSVSVSSQYSMQVEGNLSRQELRDISRVVRTFMHDLRSMMKGRDVPIANVASGNPQTLQSISATASSSTTITAVAGAAVRGPAEESGEAVATAERGALQGNPFRDPQSAPRFTPLGVALPLPVPETWNPAGAAVAS